MFQPKPTVNRPGVGVEPGVRLTAQRLLRRKLWRVDLRARCREHVDMFGERPDYRTRASLRDDLRRIGIEAGDTVRVHAAMSKVGPLLNGPDALSHALLDAVGPEGTMLVYTSWDSVHDDLLDDEGRVLPPWRDHVPGFDKAASRAVRMNGILAECVRTMPGAFRSGNPGASVAAVGRLAEWITADHPQDYGFGEDTPLAKLVEVDGRVLTVGAPWDTMTLIHHADHLARLPGKRLLRYEVPFAQAGATRWRFMEEFDTTEPVIDGMPENYIEQIVEADVGRGGEPQRQIGNAPSLRVDASHPRQWIIHGGSRRNDMAAIRMGVFHREQRTGRKKAHRMRPSRLKDAEL